MTNRRDQIALYPPVKSALQVRVGGQLAAERGEGTGAGAPAWPDAFLPAWPASSYWAPLAHAMNRGLQTPGRCTQLKPSVVVVVFAVGIFFSPPFLFFARFFFK